VAYTTDYRYAIQDILDRKGTTIAIITNGGSFNSANDYDVLLRSGEAIQHVQAIIQPLGNQEADFVTQGKLLMGDKRVYLHGSVTVDTDSTFIVPSGGSYYDVVPMGIKSWDLSGVTIYKECFIRYGATGSRALNNGSDLLW